MEFNSDYKNKEKKGLFSWSYDLETTASNKIKTLYHTKACVWHVFASKRKKNSVMACLCVKY